LFLNFWEVLIQCGRGISIRTGGWMLTSKWVRFPYFPQKQFSRIFLHKKALGNTEYHELEFSKCRILIAQDVEYLRRYIRKWAWE
jgi:hypothetical protein